MKTGMRFLARGGALAALMLALGAAPGAAQAADECRCVDRDGNRIERCSCFVQPRVRGFGLYEQADARPRIGISVDVEQSSRRDAAGALVTDVLEGGPADEAGIRRGDVITSIDGHSVFEPLDGDAEQDFDLDRSVPVQRLLAIAAELESGEEVEIVYQRDGDERRATVEAEDLSSWTPGSSRSWDGGVAVPRFGDGRWEYELRGLDEGLRSLRLRTRQDARESAERSRELRERVRVEAGRNGGVRLFGGDGSGALIIDRVRGLGYGLELVALNPSLGAYFGADEGVLVADVDEESELGLRPGDVVLRIGDRPVETPDRMRRILSSYGPDEEIALTIRREGDERTITGRIGG